MTDQGSLNDYFPDVVKHFLDHFRSIMDRAKDTTMEIQPSCIAMGPKLNMDQHVYLLKPFFYKEVRAAMFSIPSTKSLGPDRFGSGFFKSVWSVVGNYIHTAIAHLFESNLFPVELHNTTLSLIPKTDCPSKVVDYRPITCYSTLYKDPSKTDEIEAGGLWFNLEKDETEASFLGQKAPFFYWQNSANSNYLDWLKELLDESVSFASKCYKRN
ncbi:uncharacterized protein LOC133034224 [Cannabis sativa]|uniref:uncharacterized protein LOC133034224 n=1 Tax=Cannabis sativa TaxID=3483 RepID=UPI0029C9F1AA|nr:uncharacterized protein LOC133034224 [Cannabis sativa]